MSVEETITWLHLQTRFGPDDFVHLREAAAILREAKELIECIDGTSRPDDIKIIRRAERWLEE